MLAGLIPVLVVWAVSHACPVGWVADAIMGLLMAFGLVVSIREIWQVSGDFVAFLTDTASANTEADLDRAAGHLAKLHCCRRSRGFCPAGDSQRKTSGDTSGHSRGRDPGSKCCQSRHADQSRRRVRQSGEQHQKVHHGAVYKSGIDEVDHEALSAKPPCIKAKTSSETGLVTIGKDPAKAPKETMEAISNGYYVVGEDLVARGRGGVKLDLPSSTEWPLQRGQIIDPVTRKPITGDYDLMGVVDPMSPGQNITLATSNGLPVADRPILWSRWLREKSIN